jgi:hypothetical protein
MDIRYYSHPMLVIFQVLTAAGMKITVVWDVAPCGLVEVHRPDYGSSKHLSNIGKRLPQ